MIIQVLYGNDMDPMNRSFDKCPGNVQSNQLTTKRLFLNICHDRIRGLAI